MAVYAPGDSPRVGADPRDYPGLDPGMWARIRNFASGFNPIGSAQAAEAQPGGPQFQGPGTAAQSGGYPVNAAGQPQYAFPHIRQALAGGAGDTNIPAVLPHLFGDGPNVQGRPILPYTNPNTAALASAAAINTDLSGGGSSGGGGASGGWPPSPRVGGIGSDANAPVMGAGGFPTTYAPPGQQPAMPTPVQQGQQQQAAPAAPLPPSRPPGLGVDPRMQGVVPPAAAAPSPWITTFDRPNMDVAGGGRSNTTQGGVLSPGGGPAKMGMLDLSGIFGGGRAAPAATPTTASTKPRTKIDVGKIPKDMRAEVPEEKPGPEDPSILAQQRKRKFKGSSSSQGG